MLMDWKKSAPVLVILLFVLAAAGIYIKNRTTRNNQGIPAVQSTPGPEAQNPGWKMYQDTTQNVTFEYPDSLGTRYIHPQNWPPKLTLSNDKFSCKEGGLMEGRQLTIQKTIDDRMYCIEDTTQGAAGTLYSDYIYTFIKADKLVKLQFTIAYPQCDNYDNRQKGECYSERQTFNLDNLIDRIAQSVKF